MIEAVERGNTPNYFDRVDLVLLLVLTAVGFVIRFFSPIMPDFFLHPIELPWVSNCVQHTPVDAQGDLGTLCGLAYPFQRGYPDINKQLSPPNGQVFDEVYFPVDARNDFKGMTQCRPTTIDCYYNYFDPEPPLAKLLIGAGEWGYGWYRATFQGLTGDYIDLGFNTFGWRIAACIFGTLCIPAMYLLARRIWSRRFFAIIAGTLVCFDGMFFIQSRIGMIDIFPIFFILCAYFLFFVHIQSRTYRASLVSLLALGTMLGIGIASKWIVLAAWASIAFFLVLRLILGNLHIEFGPVGWPFTRGNGERADNATESQWIAYFGVGVVALIAIPLVIYVLSWYPFFARGQFQWVGFNLGSLRDLWNYQVASYEYHKNLTATHPYGSPPWSWPLLARPVLYYAEYYPSYGIDHFTGQELQARILNLGNPWIWWTSIPCVLALPYFITRYRSFPAAVILVGFLSQYLPWWPVTRVLFLYHMFGGLIFMVLAVTLVVGHLAENLRPPGRQYLVAAYLGMAVLFFGYFYPVWTALPISNAAWVETTGSPPWGPKLWLVACPNPPPPPAKPNLFCWN